MEDSYSVCHFADDGDGNCPDGTDCEHESGYDRGSAGSLALVGMFLYARHRPDTVFCIGVRITANAPSVNMIKANITTEIMPLVGSKEQADDLITYISDNSNGDDIWGVNIFGKTIEQLVDDGLNNKVSKIGAESQQKLQNTMEKIVNDGNGGMVCIII